MVINASDWQRQHQRIQCSLLSLGDSGQQTDENIACRL